MYFRQSQYEVRCEWGLKGLEALLEGSDAVVIVDVLSFSTCVDIAVARGAVIFPYRWRDESATAYAENLGAVLANPRRNVPSNYSLSPASLQEIPEGTRLVLPSPNGSTLSLSTGDVPTFAGCLRNALAVADAAQRLGKRVSVIPAGEVWKDGSLRFALEDFLGAGAIISHLQGSRSPEAEAALSVFRHFEGALHTCLQSCASGKELIERGFGGDVELAAALDVSGSAPLLKGGAYVHFR